MSVVWLCMLFVVCIFCSLYIIFFFFNDTATTEIYTLSLHDALPIYFMFFRSFFLSIFSRIWEVRYCICLWHFLHLRSEEHTSELQSRLHLVCRLLLEKKNNSLSRSRCSPSRPLDAPCRSRQSRLRMH